MTHEDGRLKELSGRKPDILEVMLDPTPDASRPGAVAAQPHRSYLVAALGEPASAVIPVPGPMPATMDEQDPGHPLTLGP